MTRHSFFKPLGLSLLVGLLVLLAGCAPIQPAAPAAAATDTPAATTAMTTTGTMTSTEAMTTTGTMTSTEAMTTTGTMTGTKMMTGTETATTTKEMSGTEGVTILVYNSPKLGPILTDDKGMTLYMFDKDAKDKSNCSGGCVKNWPLLTAADEATKVMGDGITGKFSVIDRSDGTYQVAINGMPLYYYIKDTNSHDETGQAVGDVWWVVGPDGSKITKQ